MLDIKEYLKQTRTVLVTQDAFDELVRKASAQPEQRWIPCSERLPQWHWTNPEADEDERIWDGDRVIVCGRNLRWPYSGVSCAMYGPDGWEIDDDSFGYDDEPVAWMPLPEPYREEEQDEGVRKA